MAQPKIEYDLDGTDKCVLGELHSWTISTSIQGKPTDLTEPISAKMAMEDPTRGLLEVKVQGRWFLRVIRGKGVGLFQNAEIFTDVMLEVPTDTISIEFELSGDSLTAARLGKPVLLKILAFDRIQNQLLDVDMNEFKVSIFGNGRKFLPKIAHTGVGHYEVEFEAQSPGYYAATVIYEVGNARNTVVSNFPKNRVAKKMIHKFDIQVKDMHGNIPGIGGDPIEFGISDGPATATYVKIRDHENGTYTLEFELPVEGTYVMRVKYDGEHLKQSPWRITAF